MSASISLVLLMSIRLFCLCNRTAHIRHNARKELS